MKLKRSHFFITILFTYSFTSFNVNAQATMGNVEIIQAPEIENLLQKHVALNEERKTTEGYRVQIHFGGEKKKALDLKGQFLKQFPEVGAYESYQQPNFRVRVGDFRTKLEAQKFLLDVAPYFPSAFIVADEIEWPPLD